MYGRRIAFPTGVCSAGGDLTLTLTTPLNGLLECIEYVPAASNALATGADIVVAGTQFATPAIVSRLNIGTVAFRVYPRTPVHAVADGVAIAGLADKIALADELVSIVIAQGGNATASGQWYAVLT